MIAYHVPQRCRRITGKSFHLITLSEERGRGPINLLYETVESWGQYGVHCRTGVPTMATFICWRKGRLPYLISARRVRAGGGQILGQKPVDLVMSPHGLTNSVYFFFYPNEGVSMALVADKLKAIPEMYPSQIPVWCSQTACYGASHIGEWLDSWLPSCFWVRENLRRTPY